MVGAGRRALEIERQRRCLDFAGEVILDRLAAAGEERVRVAHQDTVLGKVDLIGTRRRATLDLVQKARPGAALEEGIAARAKEKRALQCVDGAVDRPHGSKWPEIMPRPRARSAVLEN